MTTKEEVIRLRQENRVLRERVKLLEEQVRVLLEAGRVQEEQASQRLAGHHTKCWLFRTSRATGTIWLNYLAEDLLPKRAEMILPPAILELSTGSADEPTLGMVSSA